jgi:hypothetical protein
MLAQGLVFVLALSVPLQEGAPNVRPASASLLIIIISEKSQIHEKTL